MEAGRLCQHQQNEASCSHMCLPAKASVGSHCVNIWLPNVRAVSLISSNFISDPFLQMSAYSNEDARPLKCKLLSLTHITSVAVACVHAEQFNSNHPSLSQISAEAETLSILQVIILLLLFGTKKRRRRRSAAFHRIFFFFLIIPEGIQLQQCLEISEITVYLRGKKTIRAYLIPSFSRRHVLVMRFLVSPASPCFPLSPYLHLSHLSSPIFHFPLLPSWLFFKFNLLLLFLPPVSLAASLPPVSLSVQFPASPPPCRFHPHCCSPLCPAMPPPIPHAVSLPGITAAGLKVVHIHRVRERAKAWAFCSFFFPPL